MKLEDTLRKVLREFEDIADDLDAMPSRVREKGLKQFITKAIKQALEEYEKAVRVEEKVDKDYSECANQYGVHHLNGYNASIKDREKKVEDYLK